MMDKESHTLLFRQIFGFIAKYSASNFPWKVKRHYLKNEKQKLWAAERQNQQNEMRPAKIQISLRICMVYDVHSVES